MVNDESKSPDGIEGCLFLDSIDHAGCFIRGAGWDLRGRFLDLVADIDVGGLTYLDLFPASGFFSFMAEDHGANVTSLLQAPDDRCMTWRRLPFMQDEDAAQQRELLFGLNKGFSYCHKLYRSRCAIIDSARLDWIQNRFDCVILARSLDRQISPVDYLRRAADVCSKYLIVILDEYIIDDRPVIEMCMTDNLPFHISNVRLWRVSPMWLCSLLQDLGFTLHARRLDNYMYTATGFRRGMISLVFRRY